MSIVTAVLGLHCCCGYSPVVVRVGFPCGDFPCWGTQAPGHVGFNSCDGGISLTAVRGIFLTRDEPITPALADF